jgi:lysine-specific demethylase 8
MDLPASGVLFPEDQRSYEQSMTFGEFLERMLVATPEAPCYLAYTRAQQVFPSEDYDFEGLLGGSGEGTDTRVWIGSAGTRSMLHSDLKDNLFCQIYGEKHVVLVPWEQSLAAYPFPDNIVNSRIDLAEPDLDRFPRLREATLYSAVVKPGDVVFIPRGCWHDLRSRTPSISLNHWFGPPLEAKDYLGLLLKMGPRCWASTARDFVVHGVLGRREKTLFFFSPPSTGRRLYDAIRWGDFNRENDPATQ